MKSASSKEGLKKFWLYHSEKVILSIALGLTGLFFWLGFKEKPFREQTASDLSGLARQASDYIGREDAWDQIREVETRQADLDIVDRITVGSKAVDTARYPFGPISIRAKKPGLRMDPVLKAPVELVAKYFRAPVFVNPGKLKRGLASKDLLAAFPLAKPVVEDSESRPGREEPPDWGTTVQAIHEKLLPGIRPRHFGIDTKNEQAFITDVVAVTALVEFKQQKNEYLEKLMDAIGYYPSRDKPEYKYCEIQRAKVENGELGKWEDISAAILRSQDAAPSRMTMLPNAEFPSAPEIVEESSYDPVITLPIPAITQFDYRQFANHPKLASRKFDPLKKEEEKETVTNFDVPGAEDEEEEENVDEDQLIVRRGSDIKRYQEMLEAKNPKNEYKLVRFFDMSRKKPGEVYRYRIRLWLADPNKETISGEVAENQTGRGRGSDAGRGGRGEDDDPGMEMGGGGGGMSLGGGMTMGGGRGGAGDRAGAGRGGPNRGGRGGQGRGRNQGETEEDSEAAEAARFPLIPITPPMKHPDVRMRLSGAKEEKDPRDSKISNYFVKENGYEELIQIPKGREDLRACRPTPWSETVELKIPYEGKADLLAGRVDVPKGIKLGSIEIPEGESAIDLVVAYWSDVYNAMLPARKKAFRGELLNLAATVNVLNPITWQVHEIENARVDSDAVVVDMLGGRELELPKDELMKYHRPSELLLMQADGSMKVNNELDNRTRFKQAILQKDDSNEVGVAKPRAAPAEAPPRPGRGGGDGPPGGGRGGR